jgi:hypothetical protein
MAVFAVQPVPGVINHVNSVRGTAIAVHEGPAHEADSIDVGEEVFVLQLTEETLTCEEPVIKNEKPL